MDIQIVFHSGYGHTKVVAEHLGRGASAQLIEISSEGLISEENWQALDAADAIVFGSPTYMGSVSWQFKRFADDSSKRWYTRAWQDKVFGGFTNSASPSGDKQNTLIALATLAAQHGGLWVSLGQLPSSTKSATAADPNNLGGSLGLLARSPADASIEEIHTGDLRTAELYGERIASVTARLKA